MRGERSQFITQNAVGGRNRDGQVLAGCKKELILDLFLHGLCVWEPCKDHVQQNIEFRVPKR